MEVLLLWYRRAKLARRNRNLCAESRRDWMLYEMPLSGNDTKLSMCA